ncbi:hypothetical protein ACFLWS_04240 [Chloroflexota bacterium]
MVKINPYIVYVPAELLRHQTINELTAHHGCHHRSIHNLVRINLSQVLTRKYKIG